MIRVIGSFGSDKSTMLGCMNLLEKPTEGEILFRGENIEGGKTRLSDYSAKVTMVFQSFNLFNNLTVLANCTLGMRKVLGIPKAEAEERAKKNLAKVGMDAYVNAKSKQLSGGQKRRVAIARSLCMEPEVIFNTPVKPRTREFLSCVLET